MPSTTLPSPLRGSCLTISRVSTALARLRMVDQVEEEDAAASQESNICVIIFF